MSALTAIVLAIGLTNAVNAAVAVIAGITAEDLTQDPGAEIAGDHEGAAGAGIAQDQAGPGHHQRGEIVIAGGQSKQNLGVHRGDILGIGDREVALQRNVIEAQGIETVVEALIEK